MTNKIIETSKGFIFDANDIISAIDVEMQKTSIPLNQSGYFGNNLSDLKLMIDFNKQMKLLKVDICATNSAPFMVDNDRDYGFSFFLPADKVLPSRIKGYRAFKTMQEFDSTVFKFEYEYMGFNYEVIHLRRKDTKDHDLVAFDTGYEMVAKKVLSGVILRNVVLGDETTFGTDVLLEQWEFLGENGKYYPFGIKED